MAKLYSIMDYGGLTVVGDFYSWEAARAFQAEYEIPGVIQSHDDPTVAPKFAATPEPQEMTSSWARRMLRSA